MRRNAAPHKPAAQPALESFIQDTPQPQVDVQKNFSTTTQISQKPPEPDLITMMARETIGIAWFDQNYWLMAGERIRVPEKLGKILLERGWATEVK